MTIFINKDKLWGKYPIFSMYKKRIDSKRNHLKTKYEKVIMIIII